MQNGLPVKGIKPVFVVGFPRSGTTLVQLLITAHHGFLSAPETHFFSYSMQPIRRGTDKMISIADLDIIFKRLEEKTEINFEKYIHKIKQKEINGIALDILLNDIMNILTKNDSQNLQRWVEKTPRHALHISEIINLFPLVKIINVIRDPRDVVSSLIKKKKFSSKKKKKMYYIKRSWEWHREVSHTLEISKNFQNSVLTVRYEDIINRPYITMNKIMTFLGEAFDENCLTSFSANYDKVITPWEKNHKKLCSENKIIDRRKIWKTRIDLFYAKLIEIICRPLMIELRYSDRGNNIVDSIKRNFLYKNRRIN